MYCRIIFTALAFTLCTAATASADLEATLRSLEIRAEADLGDFRAEIGARTGASGAEVEVVFGSVREPAHAALCLWLARQSGRPAEVVVREYRRHGGNGWGALAKSLGIKPGSPAFHALKSGDLGWQHSDGSKGNKKGKGKGRS